MTNVELTENLESRPPQTEPRRRAHTFWDFEMPTRALDVVLAALALLGPFAIHLFFPVIPVVKSRCGASCRRACHIFIATCQKPMWRFVSSCLPHLHRDPLLLSRNLVERERKPLGVLAVSARDMPA
jgi:hypothetical protein